MDPFAEEALEKTNSYIDGWEDGDLSREQAFRKMKKDLNELGYPGILKPVEHNPELKPSDVRTYMKDAVNFFEENHCN